MPAALAGKFARWATGAAKAAGPRAMGLGKTIGRRIRGAQERVGAAVGGVQEARRRAGAFAGRNARGLIIGGGFTYGYATGEGDFTDRLVRGAGFGLASMPIAHGVTRGGGMETIRSFGSNIRKTIRGTGITSNRVNPNARFRRVVQGYVKQDGQFYRKTMGMRSEFNRPGPRPAMVPVSSLEARGAFARQAVGDVAKFTGIQRWTPAHSIGAGAIYGMMNEDVGVYEGALAGGFMHAGAKIASSGAWKGGAGAMRSAYKKQGVMAALKEAKGLPLVRGATGAGMFLGAYGAADEEGALGVAGGALKGALIGGGAATVGRAFMAAPMTSIAVAAPTAVVAGGAAEAYATWEGTGRPGFNDMEADGDLALALHKMRHGF